ncbi:hypothetical protein ACE6H2_005458 [Prunus campanulata]
MRAEEMVMGCCCRHCCELARDCFHTLGVLRIQACIQVGKDSRLQEISTRLDIGGPKDSHIQPQGPRPSALKVNKASVKIKKRPPDADVKRCRTVVIQANPSEFRSLVQRFTSTSSSPSSGDGGFSPAARLASINKTSPNSSSTSDHKKTLMQDQAAASKGSTASM